MQNELKMQIEDWIATSTLHFNFYIFNFTFPFLLLQPLA